MTIRNSTWILSFELPKREGLRVKRLRWILMLVFYLSTVTAEPIIDIDREDALRIGIKVWHNECNGRIAGLTSWNDGEKFASLGIGHFNWFPNNHPGSDKDGFPQLMKYIERCGVTVPTWLQGENLPPCPWHTQSEFQAAQNSPQMQELRQFLVNTIPLQAQFMVYRLVHAIPKLLTLTPYEDREYIYSQFQQLAMTPQGVYALVDYVNFKGEGMGYTTRRRAGWGLLQVVEGMRYAPEDFSLLQSFVWSANQALTARVQASGSGHEQRWLPGWRKRLYTYLDQ